MGIPISAANHWVGSGRCHPPSVSVLRLLVRPNDVQNRVMGEQMIPSKGLDMEYHFKV